MTTEDRARSACRAGEHGSGLNAGCGQCDDIARVIEEAVQEEREHVLYMLRSEAQEGHGWVLGDVSRLLDDLAHRIEAGAHRRPRALAQADGHP